MKQNKVKNSSMREKTHKGFDDVMDRVERISDMGKEKMNHLKEKGILARKKADDYIQKNPKKSTLMAVGVGIAAGAILTAALLRRKRRDNS